MGSLQNSQASLLVNFASMLIKKTPFDETGGPQQGWKRKARSCDDLCAGRGLAANSPAERAESGDSLEMYVAGAAKKFKR